jgi:hypothetical protein
MLLSSCHSRLLSYQFLAHQLVQKAPGIPNPAKITDGSEWLWVKSGKYATIPR